MSTVGRHYTQADREELIARAIGVEQDNHLGRERTTKAGTFRKTARIVAVQMDAPFTVETDRGPMTAVAGDWLVTNHPDDDSGSDVWSISDERMSATYEPA